MFNYNRRYFRNTRKPRPATDQELTQLSLWMLQREYSHNYRTKHINAVESLINQSAIAIFYTYSTGKLMMVVWGERKEHYTLFEFEKDGSLGHIKQEIEQKEL